MTNPTLYPKKIIVTVWQCTGSVTHTLFLKSDETGNEDKYCPELDGYAMQLTLANIKEFFLFHDNARPYISRTTV